MSAEVPIQVVLIDPNHILLGLFSILVLCKLIMCHWAQVSNAVILLIMSKWWMLSTMRSRIEIIDPSTGGMIIPFFGRDHDIVARHRSFGTSPEGV
jgi:hypothetical protein